MGIKSGVVVQLTKLGCALEVVMTPELLTHIAIHPDMVEEIVTLENIMVLDHPKVGFTDKRFEDGSRNVRVVVSP